MTDAGYSLTASSITATGATLTIAGHSGNWYYQELNLSTKMYTCNQAPAGPTSVNLTGLTASTQYVYYAHRASDCKDTRFLMTSFKTRASSGKSFSFTDVTQSTMDATLHGHTGEFWFEVTKDSQTWATCRKGSSNMSFWAMSDDTEHTFKAYSNSNCATEIASDSVKTLPAGKLTYADRQQTTADLRLDFHAGDWWYQANKAPHNTCTKAGGSTITVTGLTADTDYRYRAYSDSSCTTELDSLNFTTLASIVSVSSLGNSRSGFEAVGKYLTNLRKAAAQFTVGDNSGGYDLSSITVEMDATIIGTPGDLTVAIYSNDANNKPGTSQITLSGSNPTGTGQYTYTCSSSCNLTANGKYHLVLEAPNATGNNGYYSWETSSSGSEVAVPSGNGWSIGESFKHESGAWSDITPYLKFKVTATEK